MAKRISRSTETATHTLNSQACLLYTRVLCRVLRAGKSQSSVHVMEQRILGVCVVYGINYVLIRIESKCKAAVIDMGMCTRASTSRTMHQVNPHMNPQHTSTLDRKYSKTASRESLSLSHTLYRSLSLSLSYALLTEKKEKKTSLQYKMLFLLPHRSFFVVCLPCQFRIAYAMELIHADRHSNLVELRVSV